MNNQVKELTKQVRSWQWRCLILGVITILVLIEMLTQLIMFEQAINEARQSAQEFRIVKVER